MRVLLISAVAFVGSGLVGSADIQAQEQRKPFEIAQVQGKAIAAPKRAQPVPPKPVSEEEALRAARINNWTVGLAGGLLEGTFVRYAADLGKALDDGDNLRVLPIVSYGAVGNVSDLIYLKGVDFSITYSDVLDHFKNVRKVPGIERRINYVMPMFQGELHIYARPEIKSIRDLEGKKVNFNTVGSAANYTGGIVFDRLGIKAQRIFENNSIALEPMRRVRSPLSCTWSASPTSLFSKIKPEPGYQFSARRVQREVRGLLRPRRADECRLPQPHCAGRDGADHLGYGAARGLQLERQDQHDRYRRCVRFIEYLFDRFDKLRQPPYQPKWKEMNIAGTIPGWQRFPPAQELIDNGGQGAPAASNTSLARAQAAKAAPLDPAEQERLFRQFLEWSKQKR